MKISDFDTILMEKQRGYPFKNHGFSRNFRQKSIDFGNFLIESRRNIALSHCNLTFPIPNGF